MLTFLQYADKYNGLSQTDESSGSPEQSKAENDEYQTPVALFPLASKLFARILASDF